MILTDRDLKYLNIALQTIEFYALSGEIALFKKTLSEITKLKDRVRAEQRKRGLIRN